MLENIDQIKIAIMTIFGMIIVGSIFLYLSGTFDGTTILAMLSTGIAAVAGLAGFDMNKK